MEQRLDDLEKIFRAGVERVDPYRMILDRLHRDGTRLTIDDGEGRTEIDLGQFERILVIGAGKATAKMALAIEELLGERLTGGIIAVKRGHTEALSRIRTIEAGHPVPDEESLRAGREIAELCRGADESTLVLGLISGGGSACLCLPRELPPGSRLPAITLEDKQQTTELLLSCGAEIGEINTVRKHLSGIKGGGLARLIHPATTVNLILSDVVGDRLDAIASGLTVPDRTTFADARSILEHYGLLERVPQGARALIDAGVGGEAAENPKPGDPIFEPVSNILLGTNLAALRAAGERARALGYQVTLLSSQITGEAREAAKLYLGIALDLADHELLSRRPACVLGGGETTVTLRGAGKGGRNQELALSFMRGLAGREPVPHGISFLSAGTDGNDGPTDAAGGFVSRAGIAEARRLGLSIDRALEQNDSYPFLEAIGSLFKSGPTNTNVCDLQILIVE